MTEKVLPLFFPLVLLLKAYAGGVRSLPVLPPWRIARDLSMPRAEELRALPDVEALEAVLARLLVFDYGEGERGDGELCDAACSARIR